MADTPYFFLSYAHSGPSSEVDTSAADHGVAKFFDDLCQQVAEQAQLSSVEQVGFFDGLIRSGDDWNATISAALGRARAFVALYSPRYFNKSWTMRERESFRRRLTEQGIDDPTGYIVPVVWTPFEPWDIDEEIASAIRLVDDEAEYGENGLRALGMLTLFRPKYEQIVAKVASLVVENATRHALTPSPAPQVPEVVLRDPDFIVAVLAPDTADLPAGRGNHGYAAAARLWRPFGESQAMPIADYAESVAERLGHAVLVKEFVEVRPTLDRRPGLVLIDPWLIRTRNGSARLTAAIRGLPVWVTPLLVIDDRSDPEQCSAVVAEVRRLLALHGRADVPLMSGLDEFTGALGALITLSRRRFIKNSPDYDGAGPVVERYTLRGTYIPPATNGKKDR